MIEQLDFTVRFPPTDHHVLGRTFDRSLTFSKGMTAITGPNENGKTLTLEMIEFLLFGTAALRGKTEDYKHLKASGIVTIRGHRYSISRTVKNAALVSDVNGETLAVGTKPVNQRILAILGYGLDVFRVANIANQGDAERLSKMKPTERKAMVDRLIGADQIESVARWCGEQALGVSREITGLEKGLGAEPTRPTKPEGYRPAVELREDITSLRSLKDTIVKAEAFLANEPVVPEVGPAPTKLSLDTLVKADQVMGLRTYDFDLEAVTAQDAAHQLWKERQAFVSRAFPQPTLTAQEVQDQTTRLDLIRDLARLQQTPQITCPCGKPFTTADAEIARVERAINEIPVLKGIYDLGIEAAALRTWAKEEVQVMWERLKDAVETAEPEHHPRDAKGAVHVDEVTKALRELGVEGMTRRHVQDLAGELRAYEAVCKARDGAQARKDAWEQQAQTTRAALSLARRAFSQDQLDRTEALLSAVTVYDVQHAAFEEQMTAWTEGHERLARLRQEEASWRDAKTALDEVRQETKTYLAPALSRVASHMLAQMTGGQRGRITVDEDFEIEVDGQPLNTLSGSGKVCANLAVRLGLGRILTNGVFPVFAGDEMDASMDADRAGHLHDALTALDGKLHQILVITHKTPACPQVIKLEN